ncbi:uncharacterized protein BDR25DRAFT_317812 [Lindgomyces ingoldianus]|uniref:Uncharacterized protein n=1 Tax=Lindgomyces ingoldianus TaxID=673940 RepID=A0ACB6QHM3_9PLEO|nr:uncharacterized protein BDR25DRAFT_317812 [Lindgomyces ingoldianus]KAF2466434.1 hypothetical protein BDR25DRAFT_317812 [Lindgomyces ingoldianus]
MADRFGKYALKGRPTAQHVANNKTATGGKRLVRGCRGGRMCFATRRAERRREQYATEQGRAGGWEKRQRREQYEAEGATTSGLSHSLAEDAAATMTGLLHSSGAAALSNSLPSFCLKKASSALWARGAAPIPRYPLSLSQSRSRDYHDSPRDLDGKAPHRPPAKIKYSIKHTSGVVPQSPLQTSALSFSSCFPFAVAGLPSCYAACHQSHLVPAEPPHLFGSALRRISTTRLFVFRRIYLVAVPSQFAKGLQSVLKQYDIIYQEGVEVRIL